MNRGLVHSRVVSSAKGRSSVEILIRIYNYLSPCLSWSFNYRHRSLRTPVFELHYDYIRIYRDPALRRSGFVDFSFF